MAVCFNSYSGQLLIDQNYPAESCPGYVAFSASEYNAFVSVQNANTLTKVFSEFDSQNFGVGFGGVLLLFCTGFFGGLLINAIRKGSRR